MQDLVITNIVLSPHSYVSGLVKAGIMPPPVDLARLLQTHYNQLKQITLNSEYKTLLWTTALIARYIAELLSLKSK